MKYSTILEILNRNKINYLQNSNDLVVHVHVNGDEVFSTNQNLLAFAFVFVLWLMCQLFVIIIIPSTNIMSFSHAF